MENISNMLTKNVLLLGSKSPSRRSLLEQSKIPYVVIEQNSDELICKIGLTRVQQVSAIALQKMDHAILPMSPLNHLNHYQKTIFVLTADTLTEDSNGNIHGKPVDYDDAVAMIKMARKGMFLSTAFCLALKVWQGNSWTTKKIETHVVSAEYVIDVPDRVIDYYLKNTISLQCAGGFAIEDLGLQFVKSVHGSYSTIMGLPLFELRQALEDFDFFD